MTHSTIDNIVEFEDVQFEASQTFREKKVDPEKSTILYDELVALIEPLAIQNVRNIIKFIATYIDKNNNSLIISGPYLGLFFKNKCNIFATVNIYRNSALFLCLEVGSKIKQT